MTPSIKYIIERHWIMQDTVTTEAKNLKEAFEHARNTPRTEGYYMPSSICLDAWTTKSNEDDPPNP